MVAPSKEDVLPPWGLAVAGSTAAVVANILVYPLDIVKTRLQVQSSRKPGQAADPQHYESTLHALQKIVEDEGFAGLYSGMAGSLLGVASTNFAYFYWYSTVRTVYNNTFPTPHKPSTAVELSLGAVAGALAQLFTIPIAVVTTRQQTQAKSDRKGMLDTAKEVVYGPDGWTGLWRGFKASLVLVVNPAITYGAYQRFKDILYPDKMILGAGEAFLLGALSKSMATIATQPLIVAKVRLQSKPPADRNGVPFKSFGEVLAYTIQHEGVASLFRGIGPQILKGLLVQGLMMMSKEKIELSFLLLFRYFRQLRQTQLAKFAAAERLKATAMETLQAVTK